MPLSSLDLAAYDPQTGLITVEGTPVTYHCNIFNHFFSYGIKMALGEERGRQVVYRASEFAHLRLFREIKRRYGFTAKEMYEFGKAYFKSRGLGSLHVKGVEEIYLLSSTHAHTFIKANRSFAELPTCDVERGFVAALLEAALDTEPGEIFVEESTCIGAGDPICKMRVEVSGKKVSSPEPDYGRVNLYKVEGAEVREETMGRIAPMIPTADESGIISIRSAFSDIKAVWISQLPAEYYAYANWRVLELSDREVARFYLSLAGYGCVFFTYLSLSKTPIGDLLLGGLGDPFSKFISIGNYLGFGVFAVDETRTSGGTFQASVRLHNFYENNFAVALGSEPLSYFLEGAVLATYLLTYTNFGKRKLSMHEFIENYAKFSEFITSTSEYDYERNAQTLEAKIKLG